MSQRIKTNKTKRSRGFTYLWIAALAVLIFLLIYFEQTALLYVLATLGVTALLFVVAAADIGHVTLGAESAGQALDAQASSSGIGSKLSAAKSNQQSSK
jgi:UPF0716 family protein affecting phage T7 exclusion